MSRYACYTVEKHVKQGAECKDCGWTANHADNSSDIIAQVTAHVRDTGHSVDRKYYSRTSYAGEQREEKPLPPPKPKRTVYCLDCERFLAEKGKGIVLFWAASSHFKASGHHVEVRNPDGTIAARYPSS